MSPEKGFSADSVPVGDAASPLRRSFDMYLQRLIARNLPKPV